VTPIPNRRSCAHAAPAALTLLAALAGNASAADGQSAQVLVDREIAFQQAAVERGTRAAFLEFLADNAVLLRPEPAPGRATIERGAPPGAPLRWKPDLAMISGRGDFGWTSGPFSSFQHSTDERPAVTGHYFTVWWVEDKGAWHVVLDGGVPYPVADAALPHHLEVTPVLRRPGNGDVGTKDCAQEFAESWRFKGRAKALKDFLAKDARLLYAGIPPRDGKAIVPASDPLAAAKLGATHVTRRISSEFGDVTVSYGDYELESTIDAPPRRLLYVQAWDLRGTCKLALESLNPPG
jgi:hypothetical protein